MAEGKMHAEDDEEGGHRRGASVICKLSMKEVREALDFQARKALQKATVQGQIEENENRATTTMRVLATAEIALTLAAETAHHCQTRDREDFRSLQEQCSFLRSRQRL